MCWTLFLLFWWSISLWQDQINTWIIVMAHVVLQTETQAEQFYSGHTNVSLKGKISFFHLHESHDSGPCLHCRAADSSLSEGALNSPDQFVPHIARFYYFLSISVSCFFFFNPTERKCHFFYWMNLKTQTFLKAKTVSFAQVVFKCWLKTTFTRCSIFASFFKMHASAVKNLSHISFDFFL